MDPKLLPAVMGKTYKSGHMTIIVKKTAEDGWSDYTVCEAIVPPQAGATPHRHESYDETFIVLEGTFVFRLGEERLEAGPGDTVFVPRGTAHSWTNVGAETGRQILISSPGGVFDAMLADFAELDAAGPMKTGAEAMAILTKHGVEPLPG